MDADGNVSHVEFYVFDGIGFKFIGRDTTAPFQAVWTSPAAGDYILYANSTDNDGNVSPNSPPVNIRVNLGGPFMLPGVAGTITSPTNGQTFQAGNPIDIVLDADAINHSITRIEFYADNILIGSDSSYPYGFIWTNAPSSGSYSLTARTISSTRRPANSAPVSISIQPNTVNAAPNVSLTSPANNSQVNPNTPIVVSANATDSDGTITNVEFFADGVLIGTDNAAPYQIIWTGAQRNQTYNLTARATDNEGTARTSAPVTISTRTTSAFDFDGDGKADISVFRPSDTVWYLLNSQNGFSAAQFGLATDKITPADYDGDGKTDISVFRDGTWYWLGSSNGAVGIVQFGVVGDIPVPADFTGDGRAELAVYRGGVWWTLNLANNQSNTVQFGIASDKPVPADFDGDGKSDYAVYRDGIWYMLRSTGGFTSVQFGIATDQPTVGDYDGDGTADQAVYRDGVWYVLGSTQGSFVVQFGIASDVPAAADYDGDGKTDFAVYRDGVWYLLGSRQGFSAVQFGIASDKPIPAAFVP